MKAAVKITILKRELYRDLVDEYAEGDWPACDVFNDGQEFVSQNVEMPAGFCSWAWADIQKYVMALARGADFVGVKPGVSIAADPAEFVSKVEAEGRNAVVVKPGETYEVS